MLFKLGTLKIRLIVLAIILLVFFLFIFIVGAFQILNDESGDDEEGVTLSEGDKELSEEVEGYRDDVEDAAEENDIKEQTDVLLALMMQESGGKGDDVFQASESKCGSIGCITDTQESIDQGVKYYAKQLDQADGDIKTALQSYNFGDGFIDYANDEGGYSKEVAVEFSKEQYEKVKDSGNYSCINPEYSDEGACYGDVEYVDHVLQYYQPESADAITSIEQDDEEISGDGEWDKPIDGDPEITSDYGKRDNPTGDGGEKHEGIDFACTGGATSIKAVEDGKVEYSEFNDGGFGNLVMIKHGDTYSHYAHMSDRAVKKGDKVEKGDKVGVCGTTGQSTGAHLHFEAKKPKENLFTGQFDPKDMLE